MIELIRDNRIADALVFAQEYLSEKAESLPHVCDELEKTMSLLAFDEAAKSPFAHLLDLSHRRQLSSGQSLLQWIGVVQL